jgi:hypothetical protein
MLFQLLKGPCKYRPWQGELGNAHIRFIDHLRNPPQVLGSIWILAAT